MPQNILVISTSLRKNSNSEALADAFIAGAEEAGHHVEKISLRGKEIAFCKGCLACQQKGKCVIDDDAVTLPEKIRHAEIIVFATPIYYYEMSGQMKTLLDRANALFESDYDFRRIYLLSAAAEEGNHVPEKAISGLKGWIDCFEKAFFGGSVFAGGVTDPGEIKNHPALKEAEELGKSL